jgi:hypothetical protein
MDDNDRLARLERKIDGLERKIDDLKGISYFLVFAVSLGWSWIIPSIIRECGWAKEYEWLGNLAGYLAIVIAFAVITNFTTKRRNRM